MATTENKEIFNKALANYINDAASGGAVRHLADLGYSVSEIVSRLDYPLSKSVVADMVWKHYLDSGIIRLQEPKDGDYLEKISYVKDVGAYGRTSLRRVVEKVDIPKGKYVRCEFGKLLYRKDDKFIAKLDKLGNADRDYILDLPWPLTPVYHVLDDRMSRLFALLENDLN